MSTIVIPEYDYNISMDTDEYYNEDFIADIDKKWHKYKTFSGLLKNMREFILGNIPNTPNHMGKLQDYDPDYIQRLLALNSMNILTTCGQEFKKNITKDKIFMQREYVEFVYKIPKNRKLSDLIKKFNDADLFYYALNCSDKKVYQTPNLGKIGFDNPEFWVTRTLNRKDEMFDNHTHIPDPCDINCDMVYYSSFAKDFYDRTVIFMVWNKTWDEEKEYLIDKIIPCFE